MSAWDSYGTRRCVDGVVQVLVAWGTNQHESAFALVVSDPDARFAEIPIKAWSAGELLGTDVARADVLMEQKAERAIAAAGKGGTFEDVFAGIFLERAAEAEVAAELDDEDKG